MKSTGTGKTAVIDQQNNLIKYTEAYCAFETYVLFPDTYKNKLASHTRVKKDLCKTSQPCNQSGMRTCLYAKSCNMNMKLSLRDVNM